MLIVSRYLPIQNPIQTAIATLRPKQKMRMRTMRLMQMLIFNNSFSKCSKCNNYKVLVRLVSVVGSEVAVEMV